MKRIICTLLFSLVALGGFSAPSALSVLSGAPKGAQGNMGRQAVTVTFNQPVAKLGENSQFATENCPLTLTPNVEGTCRFSGTQTLLFEPKDAWPAATSFTVTVPAGFTSQVSHKKLAKAYSFSFQTQVPQVERVLPHNNEHWLTLTPTLYVLFSMPVDVQRANKFVKLSAQNGTVPVSVRAVTEDERKKNLSYAKLENIVAISPLAKLQKGTKYTLELMKGLPATAGNAGMADTYTSVFYTYPNLTIFDKVDSGCLPYNASVQLSSPVRMSELYAFTEVVPASAKEALPEALKDQLGSEVSDSKTGRAYFKTPLSFIKLTPREPVKVTLKKGLSDIFGNRLVQDYTFTLTNDGYCPAADFSGGLGVLESYLKPYLPIELVNILSLPVRGARFNKDNFISFDQTEKGYCKEVPLSETVFAGNYDFKTPKDKSVRTFIDLLKFKPTATDSIIFSQVQLPRGEGEKPCWVSSTDNITDLGLTFKTSPNSILVWVTSLKTGEVLPGKHVELRDKTNRILWSGTTDANGLARAEGWDKLGVESPRWGMPAIYAFVQSDNGDGVLSNLWNDGLELWRFNLNFSYAPQQEVFKSYLFTDRGIYRPGETVYLKGVGRAAQNGAWGLPGAKAGGKVTVTDERGEEVFSKDVSFSDAYGTFDLSFPVSKQARTGNWSISFSPFTNGKPDEENASYTYFQVEDLKPADFNVTLRAMQPDYLPGEEARFVGSAHYQFGAPLAQANAKWTLRQVPLYFNPKGYDKYVFVPYFVRDTKEEDFNKLLLSSSGQLDNKGTVSFDVRTPRVPYPVTLATELSVESTAKQQLFARTSITVHPADFYLGTKVTTEDAQAGKPVTVHVVSVTAQGNPVSTVATAEIYREQWYNVRKTGLSGRLEWVSDKEIITYPSQTVEVTKKGANLTFTPDKGGWYYVKLTSKDLFGRPVIGGAEVYVSGNGYMSWKQNEDDLIKIIPNKNEYKVGQTARLVVQNPYENATALVSIEREGVLDAWVETLKNGQDTLRIAIKENYLPNVYVSVTLVNGRTAKPVTEKLDLGKPQAKTGYAQLNVVPERKKLQTTLKTSAKNFRPQETVTVDITTRQNGKNVPAEVTVMVVDEGILALTKYTTPDLFSYFYGPRPLSVFTADNRFFVIGQRSFGEKGENRGGGGSALNSLAGTDLRSDFRFTPYFAAQVKTNEKGRGQVSFKLPDNLTAFRIMAVGLTTDAFGSAETKISVSKPLMITANLPRFARKGDSFACGAVVHNYEDKDGLLTVSATAQGAIKLTGEAQTITLPRGQTKAVSWPCEAVANGQAQVAFSVKGKKEQDGVRADLTIVSVEKPQTLAVLGKTDDSQEEWLDRPALVTGENNVVGVTLASSILPSLQSAVNYLATYPFDCLEQQLSKILPALLSLKGVQMPSEYRKTVENVFENMGLYQTAQGGLAYWKNALPDPYLTAYALDVAQLAKKQGYLVPEKVLNKAASWLETAFSTNTRTAYEYDVAQSDIARAYSTYVLCLYGKNAEGLFNTLYARRNSLPVTAVAYLLQAASALKRPQTEKEALLQVLNNHTVYNPTTAYIAQQHTHAYLHIDDTAATALALEALVSAGQAQKGYLMASWLVKQANAQGYFSNTYTSAQVLRALSDYEGREQAKNPYFTAQVSAADKLLWTQEFTQNTPVSAAHTWPFEQFYGTSDDMRLKLAKKGTGTLFYTLSQTYEPKAFEKPIHAGMQITRTLTAQDGTPVTSLKAGERYRVNLTVTTPAPRWFVAVEDFVPAGFEIVNSSLATESHDTDDTPSAFGAREIYDGRIAAFADFLPAGTHTFTYTVSVLCAGTFNYPAAWASLMYEPEVFGRTQTTSITLLP